MFRIVGLQRLPDKIFIEDRLHLREGGDQYRNMGLDVIQKLVGQRIMVVHAYIFFDRQTNISHQGVPVELLKRDLTGKEYFSGNFFCFCKCLELFNYISGSGDDQFGITPDILHGLDHLFQSPVNVHCPLVQDHFLV